MANPSPGFGVKGSKSGVKKGKTVKVRRTTHGNFGYPYKRGGGQRQN